MLQSDLVAQFKNKGLLAIVVALLLGQHSGCWAANKPDLTDESLLQQYDWAMYIDVRPVEHYLNYAGAQLRPLTKAAIAFRYFPRNMRQKGTWPAKTYEEFWYHKGKPVGMRRYGQIKIDRGQIGVIILGPTPHDRDAELAAANALVRLSLDLQFQQVLVAGVKLQEDQYDQLVADLRRYHFNPGMQQNFGPQMSIHLLSDARPRHPILYLHR